MNQTDNTKKNTTENGTVEYTIAIPSWATHVISDNTDWDRNPKPVAEVEQPWRIVLPNDAYFEYGFLDGDGNPRPDPTNNRVADNPWTDAARVLTGPDYTPDACAELTRQDTDDSMLGKTTRGRVESDRIAGVRRYSVYTPKGHADTRMPTIYLQDGVAYHRYAKLPVVLETLLSEDRIRPGRLVFVEPDDRLEDYSFNEDFLDFMQYDLVPHVEKEIVENGGFLSGERVVMGASLGGFFSACLAWRAPHMFKTIVSQSGAFLGTPEDPHPYSGSGSWLLEQLQTHPPKPLRWYLSCGTFDWLLERNREIVSVLAEKKYRYTYRETHSGHHWTTWKNDFATALSFALAKH